MNGFIGFAEIAGAMIAAVGLALGLEWVGLYGLTSMMPGRIGSRSKGKAGVRRPRGLLPGKGRTPCCS